MEAMACGLPFVAYNAPGFDELIDNKENGILVDGGVKEFASALQSLIKSQALREKIGQNAIKKAREFFGIERNANKYLDFVGSGLNI